jgi:perosamine synthetase
MIKIGDPQIGLEELEAVRETLLSKNIASGEKVALFERMFSGYTGTKFAVATSNGTTALHTALLSLGIGPGDEVITTPFSFIATANSILYCGAKPVFADIDPRTYNIDPDSIRRKITNKTRAVLVVHLYGQPCDILEIRRICEENKLFLVEDACQAHGAEFDGKKAGSFGDVACFSFYATKNMTTGEGGIIVTNDEETSRICRKIINHGQFGKYSSDILGYNYRMTDIQASIGICQLKKLDKMNSRRIENARFFDRELNGVSGVNIPFVLEKARHVYHQYTVKIKKNRDSVLGLMNNSGISAVAYYPTPIHKQKLYQKLGYNDSLKNSEEASEYVLSIPVHPGLSEEDRNQVVETLKKSLLF